MIRIGSELNGSFNPPLPAGGNLKILFIGNSFTVDATEHLPGMLKSAGITHVRMVRAYHGGYKLPEFFENYAAPDICTYYYCEPGATKWENEGTLNRSLKSIVESDTWDIVTLQEHTGSYYAWEWDETERARFPDFATTSSRRSPRPAHDRCHHGPGLRSLPLPLSEVFRQPAGDVRGDRGPGAEDHRPDLHRHRDPLGNVAPEPADLVAEQGQRMDLTRDSYHMDYGISRYAAAATVFRTLVTPCTGVSVEGNGYRYSTSSTSTTGYSTPVTDANAPVAIRAALEACRTPYAVTDMSKY